MATSNKDLGIVCPVPMGDWQANVSYQKLNTVRSHNATYQARKANQGVEPTVTMGWQEVWQIVAQDGAETDLSNYYTKTQTDTVINNAITSAITTALNTPV